MEVAEPVCRLCNKVADLTEDHVPPRSITGGAPALKRDLVEYLANPNVVRGATKQNGIKFKTICATCNSKLGSRFDPELTKLANFCRGFFWAGGMSNINFSVKPARIARAVAGHLVAGTLQGYQSKFDIAVQKYFDDETSYLPEHIKIYCWIHAFETTIIMRDTCIVWTALPGMTLVDLLKFLPLGFAFATEGVLPSAMDITNLVRCGLDDVRLMPCPPIIDSPGWPEAPADGPEGRMILGGKSFSEGTFAVPKPEKNSTK